MFSLLIMVISSLNMLLFMMNIISVGKLKLMDIMLIMLLSSVMIMYINSSIFISLSVVSIMLLLTLIWTLLLLSLVVNNVSYRLAKSLFRSILRLVVSIIVSLMSLLLGLVSKMFRFMTYPLRFFVNFSISEMMIVVVMIMINSFVMMFDWIKMLVQTYLLSLLLCLYINENCNGKLSVVDKILKMKYKNSVIDGLSIVVLNVSGVTMLILLMYNELWFYSNDLDVIMNPSGLFYDMSIIMDGMLLFDGLIYKSAFVSSLVDPELWLYSHIVYPVIRVMNITETLGSEQMFMKTYDLGDNKMSLWYFNKNKDAIDFMKTLLFNTDDLIMSNLELVEMSCLLC